MGFWAKLKRNFIHGGVKLTLQAPASASIRDASVPVTITLAAGSEPASITNITIELVAETRGQSNAESSRVIATTKNDEPFALAPNETKVIQSSLILNAGAAAENALPEGSAAQAAAHALEGLETLANVMQSGQKSYYVRAAADVEGIVLDPSDRRQIQLLKPGEIGGALNIL